MQFEFTVVLLTLAVSGTTVVSFNQMFVKEKWPPKFCNDLDCPYYTVIETTEDYETRHYNPTTWVATAVTGVSYDEAKEIMFTKLYDYISGKNAKMQKLPKTTPILTRIVPAPGVAYKKNFTMAFFIPESVTSPPVPTDKTVYILSRNSTTLYARSFSGMASPADWLWEAAALTKALPKSAQYNHNLFYTAVYESPFHVLNRHNEVWFA